jgi:hypothetical protein
MLKNSTPKKPPKKTVPRDRETARETLQQPEQRAQTCLDIGTSACEFQVHDAAH